MRKINNKKTTNWKTYEKNIWLIFLSSTLRRCSCRPDASAAPACIAQDTAGGAPRGWVGLAGARPGGLDALRYVEVVCESFNVQHTGRELLAFQILKIDSSVWLLVVKKAHKVFDPQQVANV